MKYAVVQIDPNKSYGITIGSRVKPDSEFREQVVSQIDRAMSSFNRDKGQTHTLAIVPDWEPGEPGLPEVPVLTPGAQYLIFALLYSDSGSKESLSNSELELYRKEIEGMLGGLLDRTKASLVLLQDCTIRVMETWRGASVGGIFA
jgi:hypothetical protein